MSAAFEDIAQRFLTFNKREQRRGLQQAISQLALPPRSLVLDFGCGTGLFADVFIQAGYRYIGYDVAPHLLRFATKRFPHGTFVTEVGDLRRFGPFDLILENCCFHHISDAELQPIVGTFANLLRQDGTFLLIDLLLESGYQSIFRLLYNRLERGAFVRTATQYEAIVRNWFDIADSRINRSHLFSWSSQRNPVYNDLLMLRCTKRKPGLRQLHAGNVVTVSPATVR